MGLFHNIRQAKMPFHRFVEIGRIAVLQDGPRAGKIAAIVDVIDQNRVLIDGPQAGVERQEYKIKSLHLTPLKVTFAFSARTKVVRKAWEDEKISEKWAESESMGQNKVQGQGYEFPHLKCAEDRCPGHCWHNPGLPQARRQDPTQPGMVPTQGLVWYECASGNRSKAPQCWLHMARGPGYRPELYSQNTRLVHPC